MADALRNASEGLRFGVTTGDTMRATVKVAGMDTIQTLNPKS